MIIFQRSKFRQLLRPSRPSCALEVETVFFDNLVNWNVFRWQRHPCHRGQAVLCICLAREGRLFLHFNSLAGFKVEAFCVWRFNIEFLFVNELVLHLTLTLGDWLCVFVMKTQVIDFGGSNLTNEANQLGAQLLPIINQWADHKQLLPKIN